MINCNHIKPYKSKIRSDNVKYSTYAVPYSTTYDMKVSFSMPEFSIRKTLHTFSMLIIWGEILGSDMTQS